MNATRSVAAALVVLATVTGVTLVGAAPAAAQTSGTLQDVLDDPSEDTTDRALDGLSTAIAWADGATARALAWGAQNAPVIESDRPGAIEEADAVASYYNSHNATLERYVNQRTGFDQNHTVEISWTLHGDTEQRYLVATVGGDGNLTRTEIVENTSRDPTHVLDTCRLAAANSAEELQTFTEKFAGPDKDVTRDYLAKLKGKYNKDVETSLFPSEGDCDGS